MAPYAESTDELCNIADGEEQDVAEALEAGAAEIDIALASGGYETPVDTSLLTNADLQSRFTAYLAHLNRIKAAGILSAASSDHGASGQSARLKKDLERCDRILENIATGKLQLPFPQIAASETVGLFVAGDQRFNRQAVECAFDGLDVALLVDATTVRVDV